MTNLPTANFWRDKQVLVTGHTGFKGAWLVCWLTQMGAQVTGLSLSPSTQPSLFTLADIETRCESTVVDLKDHKATKQAVQAAQPEIVIHLAAQALVAVGVAEPCRTFATNVMGTVHLLDALNDMGVSGPSLILVVTSDKVYARKSAAIAFTEEDSLGGSEPYSASKAATEMVVDAYRASIFAESQVTLLSARGGNVVGGGDFAPGRLIPDIWRALRDDKPLVIRLPQATRPWQHVLDCLAGYLRYIEVAATNSKVPVSLNFGPPTPGISVLSVVNLMQGYLGSKLKFEIDEQPRVLEHTALSIDATLAKKELNWQPRLTEDELWRWTAHWYAQLAQGSDMVEITQRQLDDYLQLKLEQE